MKFDELDVDINMYPIKTLFGKLVCIMSASKLQLLFVDNVTGLQPLKSFS